VKKRGGRRQSFDIDNNLGNGLIQLVMPAEVIDPIVERIRARYD
jgi:hypothetical protein